jgi:hypothetical protein
MPDPTAPARAIAAAADAAGTAHSPAIVDPAALPADLARETQAAFLRTLAQWGNVRAAALQVGVSRAHLYRMRRASPEFRQLWDAALVIARPQVEEVLADRALNGTEETVFYHGEEVAVRKRFDARLLLAHLGRLDRIEGEGMTYRAVAEFDDRVARLLDPPPVWDEDEDDYDVEDDYDDDDCADADAAAHADADDNDDGGPDWAAEAGHIPGT